MLTRAGPPFRQRKGPLALPGLSSPNRDWFNQPAFADLAAIADFNNDRYAVTPAALADIPAATATRLCAKRACSFAEWFAFTCSSTVGRTYLDGSGAMRNDLAIDRPRLDRTNGRRQLALSDAATNLHLQSNNMGDAAWTKGAGNTVTEASGAGLAGDSAWAFNPSTASSQFKEIRQSFTSASGTFYTDSYMVKYTGAVRYVQLLGNATAFGTFIVNFDLLSGTVTQFSQGSSAAGIAYGILPLPNGWFRIWASVQAIASEGTARLMLDAIPAADSLRGVTWTATSGSSFLIGNAQRELTGTLVGPSSYIPTGASAVTRAIESARLSPTIEAILARAAASIVVRGQSIARPNGQIAGLAGAGSLLFWQSNRQVATLATPSGLNSGSGPAAGANPFGVAAGWSAAGRSLVRDGSTLVSDGSVPTIGPEIYLGRNGANAAFGDGWYDFVAIAPERLSDARLAELGVTA